MKIDVPKNISEEFLIFLDLAMHTLDLENPNFSEKERKCLEWVDTLLDENGFCARLKKKSQEIYQIFEKELKEKSIGPSLGGIMGNLDEGSKKEMFADLLIKGSVSPDSIENYIEDWHKSNSKLRIYEYLGLSQEEYFAWLKDPNSLVGLLKNR